jgi:hypothetical protein
MWAHSTQIPIRLRANQGDDADLRAEDDRGFRRREPDGHIRRRAGSDPDKMKWRQREGAEFFRFLRELRAAVQ